MGICGDGSVISQVSDSREPQGSTNGAFIRVEQLFKYRERGFWLMQHVLNNSRLLKSRGWFLGRTEQRRCETPVADRSGA